MALLPCLTRTGSIFETSAVISAFFFYFRVVSFIFYFQSPAFTKIENEDNNTKTLTAEISKIALWSLKFSFI